MTLAEINIEVDAGALLLLPLILLIGWFAARMLGVRQTWFRTFFTGFFGWVLGVVLAGVSAGEHPTSAELAVRVVAFSVLATMAIAIALDFMARPGREDPYERLGRLPKLPHPVKRVQRTLAPPLRFREVLGIARHDGLLHRRFASAAGIADPKFGPCLRSTLEDCGGMFIKLGQVASTRSDLLPAPVIAELTQLQSSVAPVAPDEIREVVEEELGRPVEEVFATFDWTPLAAASIGQVHRATLASGERVVVKVQRPDVADVVNRDTQAMLSLARFVQRRTSIGLRTDVVTLVGEFTDAVNAELDFTAEGQAGERIRNDRGGDAGIHIPTVHLELCTRRLLVLEEVAGVPISDQAALDASPVPRDELASRLLQCFLAQILEDGVFHADPHPGNILLAEDGTMTLLDFGSTGILDPSMLEALGGLLLASTLKDPELLQRAVLAISPPPPGTDLTALEADLGRFMVLHVNGSTGFDVGMLKSMIDVLQHNHLPVPTSLTLLSRALITLDGTIRTMAPGLPVRAGGPGAREPDGHARRRHRRGQRHDAEGAAPGDAVVAHAARARRGDRRTAPVRAAHLAHAPIRGCRRSCVRTRPREPGDAHRRRPRRDPHRRRPPARGLERATTRPHPPLSRASATSACSSARSSRCASSRSW